MNDDASLESLVAGVELFSLDAGNTVIFLDHQRLADLLVAEGFAATRAELIVHEGEAKRLLEDGAGTRARFPYDHAPGARSWGNLIGSICVLAGVPERHVSEMLARFWRVHMEKNLWWLVPPGLGPALDAVRASGVPVVVVSNSEGMLAELFADLDVARHFDLVVDSGKVGIEKPDPRIWQIALAAYPTPPDRVLHLGDTYATDTIGAQRLGYRTALIDPYAHYEGRHLDVPRVPGVVDVARAIVRFRSRGPASP